MSKNRHLLTIADASTEIGISQNALYRLVNGEKGHGIPPHYRLGGKILIDVSEILEWAKVNGTQRAGRQSGT